MEEEFKVVKRKKKKGKTCQVVRGEQVTTANPVVDIEKVIARLDACKRELEESRFWLKFKETVTRSLEVASSSYKCQQTSKKDETQKGRNLQDYLSPLTLHNHMTNNCKTSENLTNSCHGEANDNDTINADSGMNDTSGRKIQRDEQEILKDDKRLEEVRLETIQGDHDQRKHTCFSVDAIVCYGLGNFSSCINAKYQLSLLLLLLGYLEIAPSRCFCYDPVFTSIEHDILKGFGVSCLEFNEEGKRMVYNPTIFYMPHCGKPLYNNLLWRNWGNPLTNLIIIGNSFKNFDERFPSKLLEEEVPYIQAILPFTHQIDVENNFKFLDIFNDIGVHVFPIASLQQAPSTLWTSENEPNYCHLTDVEIIVNKS